jgi:ribosomal protein L29
MADSIRQKIVDAVKARLQGILVSGGYQTDVGANVFVWKGADFAADELPACDVRDVRDDIDNTVVSTRREHHRLTFEVAVAVADGTDSMKTARKAIADVYQAIGVDRLWTVSGTRLAFDTELKSDESGIEQRETTLAGAKITFVVSYRTAAFDPYTNHNT